MLFYSTLKKNKLATFKNMTVKKVVNSKKKTTIIATERSIFGRISILVKSRQSLSLKYVLKFWLSPI